MEIYVVVYEEKTQNLEGLTDPFDVDLDMWDKMKGRIWAPLM